MRPTSHAPGRRRLLRGSLALAGLGLLVGCEAVPPQTPRSKRIPRLGFLASNAPPPTPAQQAFFQALHDLGYADGQTIAVEYRWAEAREERLPALAAELVALDVDVIYAFSTTPAQAAKGATGTIPIVFGASNDPIGAGLVASLARPGGNVTGMSGAGAGLSAKRVQLLKEVVPGLSRVAILAYAAGASTERDWGETHAAGLALGLRMQRHDVRAPGDFEGAFAAMAVQGAEALIVLVDSFFGRDGGRAVLDLAARYHLPSMHEHRVFTDAGGLLSYGANIADTHRRAATSVDKILKGAKPADLPVEQPTTFEFVVNLKTAQALGLTISESALLQATAVIQ